MIITPVPFYSVEVLDANHNSLARVFFHTPPTKESVIAVLEHKLAATTKSGEIASLATAVELVKRQQKSAFDTLRHSNVNSTDITLNRSLSVPAGRTVVNKLTGYAANANQA